MKHHVSYRFFCPPLVTGGKFVRETHSISWVCEKIVVHELRQTRWQFWMIDINRTTVETTARTENDIANGGGRKIIVLGWLFVAIISDTSIIYCLNTMNYRFYTIRMGEVHLHIHNMCACFSSKKTKPSWLFNEDFCYNFWRFVREFLLILTGGHENNQKPWSTRLFKANAAGCKIVEVHTSIQHENNPKPYMHRPMQNCFRFFFSYSAPTLFNSHIHSDRRFGLFFVELVHVFIWASSLRTWCAQLRVTLRMLVSVSSHNFTRSLIGTIIFRWFVYLFFVCKFFLLAILLLLLLFSYLLSLSNSVHTCMHGGKCVLRFLNNIFACLFSAHSSILLHC